MVEPRVEGPCVVGSTPTLDTNWTVAQWESSALLTRRSQVRSLPVQPFFLEEPNVKYV